MRQTWVDKGAQPWKYRRLIFPRTVSECVDFPLVLKSNKDATKPSLNPHWLDFEQQGRELRTLMLKHGAILL